MATPTTGTRTTKPARLPSADYCDVPFSYEELVRAYLDCRRSKRNSRSALAFEWHLERNLYQLYIELLEGEYRPGPSICFVVTRPKPREVWAADFRDRVVHHLLYNRIGPQFERTFIADSYACIPGRGTMHAAESLESKVRSITQNWSKPAYYLKLDISSFFVGISQSILWSLLSRKITDPWWIELAKTVVFHDPRQDFEFHGDPVLLDRVPMHKRLMEQPTGYGLPIGNLSSQFFANVYLNEVDQFIKHRLKVRHYCRYVDDMVFLHESATRLNEVRAAVEAFLPERLELRINPSKTVLQPIDRGVDFVGHVIKPWRRYTRRRTFNEGLRRVASASAEDVFEMANSYFGLLGQANASHQDRARLANVLRDRGHSVDGKLTKTFRRTPTSYSRF